MVAKRLVVTNKARKQSKKLPSQVKKHVALSLLKIRENPFVGTKLKGELGEYYKYRVGDYRVVYFFDKKNDTVVISKIEHRQGVYK